MNGENLCETVTPSKKMWQTETQLEKARENKERFFNAIKLLTERLKPALRPQSLMVVGESCEKEKKLTDIAEAIKDLASDFNLAKNQIENLIDRLEI